MTKPESTHAAPPPASSTLAGPDERSNGRSPGQDAFSGHPYQEGQTIPRLFVHHVATGGLMIHPSVPDSVGRFAASRPWGASPGVLVLDLGQAKFETEVLLDMFTPLARDIHAGRFGDVMLVVVTNQESVRRIVQMVAETEDVPVFLAESATNLHTAWPAGKLTPTERHSLRILDHLGGTVTASRFATEASLEITAAGNRLSNLAKRGYLFRVARSRRDGDLFVGLTGLNGGPDAEHGSNSI